MWTLLRFCRIRPEERRVFFKAVWLMAAVRIALWFSSVQRVTRWLNSMEQKNSPGASHIELNNLARRIVQAARFCPLPPTCLVQALVADALLKRYGHSATLRIGVLKSEGRLNAHAWLECPGGVLIGDPMPDGRDFVRLHGAEALIR